MNSTAIPILVTGITAVVTVAGWFITKAIDRNLKRAESRRAYIQKQIEEFYGPLYSLTWQILTSNHLKDQIFSHCRLNEEEASRVRRYFAETYFLPLHNEVKSILQSKLYLVEGATIPEKVYEYLEHALQEDTQHLLWQEHGVSTVALRGSSFPAGFLEIIETTLKKLMREYEVSIQGLKTGRSESSTREALAKVAQEEEEQARMRERARDYR